LLRSYHEQEDGFFAPQSETPWRLGAVLLADRGDAFVMVRKAPVADGKYEFAGLLALPGGMVRVRDWVGDGGDIDTEALMIRSLDARVLQETSLRAENRSEIVAANLGPIVTSYSAKGKQRFTLLVAHTCQVSNKVALHTADHSIDEASWMPFAAEWNRFAPANCVAIAHLVWGRISAADQVVARPHVEEAIKKCSSWGEATGWLHLPGPWADADELAAWRSAWTTDIPEPSAAESTRSTQ
jgi:hypothetical protein